MTPESPYGEAGGGGIAAYLRALIPALVERGHQITVLANATTSREFWAESGRVCVVHFKLPALHWYSRRLPLARRTFILALRQTEWSWAFARQARVLAAHAPFDVLEATETGGLYLNRIAPTVIRLHGSEWIFRKYTRQPHDWNVRTADWLEARACERARAITTPSHFQAREIAARRGWEIERIRVIPNPISAVMMRAGLETPPRQRTDTPVILYTGRLAPVKGIEVLLQAARLVHQDIPSATFVLAGTWQMPRPPQTYGLALNAKSQDGVLWVGSKTQEELIALYRQATCFVMPSYYETFGISVLEALAFGLPVVATKVGGLTEIVSDPAIGQLTPPGEAELLASALVRSPGDLPVLAAQNAVLNFSAERVAAMALTSYLEIASRNDKHSN